MRALVRTPNIQVIGEVEEEQGSETETLGYRPFSNPALGAASTIQVWHTEMESTSYDDGQDALRLERLQRLKTLGMVDVDIRASSCGKRNG